MDGELKRWKKRTRFGKRNGGRRDERAGLKRRSLGEVAGLNGLVRLWFDENDLGLRGRAGNSTTVLLPYEPYLKRMLGRYLGFVLAETERSLAERCLENPAGRREELFLVLDRYSRRFFARLEEAMEDFDSAVARQIILAEAGVLLERAPEQFDRYEVDLGRLRCQLNHLR